MENAKEGLVQCVIGSLAFATVVIAAIVLAASALVVVGVLVALPFAAILWVMAFAARLALGW